MTRYFEKLIQTHLLDNVHRTTLRLKPDPEEARRTAQEEQARLADHRATLNETQIAELVAATRDLKRRQETPDYQRGARDSAHPETHGSREDEQDHPH